MKRFHDHAHVDDLPTVIASRSRTLAADRTRVERDHAKWLLDDLRIDFAASTRGGTLGAGSPVAAPIGPVAGCC